MWKSHKPFGAGHLESSIVLGFPATRWESKPSKSGIDLRLIRGSRVLVMAKSNQPQLGYRGTVALE
jgi:hypothetical protein